MRAKTLENFIYLDFPKTLCYGAKEISNICSKPKILCIIMSTSA